MLLESVNFGTELSSHAGSSKLTDESFQFFSVLKTLQSLLCNKDYVQRPLNDECNTEVFQDFADGDKCEVNPLFSNSSKTSIMYTASRAH